MHYWGYKIRSKKIAERHNPYIQLLNHFKEEEKIVRLLKASKYIPTCIVPDFEMVPYVSQAYQRIYILPLAVRCKKITPPVDPNEQRVPLIVHVPNVVILNCENNLTCIRLLLVFRAKSCVTIKHNLLSRFVMHYNHGLLRPDGEQ